MHACKQCRSNKLFMQSASFESRVSWVPIPPRAALLFSRKGRAVLGVVDLFCFSLPLYLVTLLLTHIHRWCSTWWDPTGDNPHLPPLASRVVWPTGFLWSHVCHRLLFFQLRLQKQEVKDNRKHSQLLTNFFLICFNFMAWKIPIMPRNKKYYQLLMLLNWNRIRGMDA